MPEGVLIAVVGPSGAGKDTLLNGAAEALAERDDIHFVRRAITRDADGATEDHDTLTAEDFACAKEHGAFCLFWNANGLSYALPASALAAKCAGRIVVANLSRGVIADAVKIFGSVVLVEITASTAVLVERLKSRARESAADIENRLSRSRDFAVPAGVLRHVVIDNSGAPQDGARQMVEAITGARVLP